MARKKSALSKANAKKQSNKQRRIDLGTQKCGDSSDNKGTVIRQVSVDNSNVKARANTSVPNSPNNESWSDVVKRGSLKTVPEFPNASSNSLSVLPTRNVLASYHQGHDMFGYAAGKQCMSSAYCSLTMHHIIKSAHTWTAKDIEDLLWSGSKMYMENIPTNGGYLSIEELPRHFTLANSQINVENIFCEIGLINHSLGHASNTAMFTQLLNNVFSGFDNTMSNGALLTMASNSTAVLTLDNGYLVFDSHSRNNFGKPSPNGSAGLFYFADASSLSNYVICQSRLLTTNRNVLFELCRVKFDAKQFASTVTASQSPSVLDSDLMSETENAGTFCNAKDVEFVTAHDSTNNEAAESNSTVVVTPLVKPEPKSLKRCAILDSSAQDRSEVPANEIFSPPSNKRRRNYYQESAEYREKVKKRARQKYAFNAEYRNAKKWNSIKQYLTNDNLRKKYRCNEEYRDSIKSRSIKKYASDVEHKESVKSRSVRKYASDKQHKESVKSHSIQKYASDEQHRESVKSRSVKKYTSDVEHRESLKLRSAQKYAENNEYKKGKKSRSVKKYASDVVHKESVKSHSIQKYASDEQHRESVKSRSIEKYASDEQHRESVKSRSVQKYASDEKEQQNLKTRSHETYKKLISKRCDIAFAIEEFRKEAIKGPTYVCCVCHRLLFNNQVKLCKHDSYINEELVKKCFNYKYEHLNCTGRCSKSCKGTLRICHTCDNHICNGNMPPQAVANNMQLLERDDVFSSLNSLEHQLISLCLPFEKLITLVRSRQQAIRGPVVCVPSNINNVTAVLPVSLHDSKIIPIKLKRKLVYKGHAEYQLVDTGKLGIALRKLIDINPFYFDVCINTAWEGSTCEGDNVLNDIIVKNSEGVSQVVENEDQEEESEPSEIIDGNVMDSCLQPVDLLSELNMNNIDSVSIAPAEGNQPLSLMSAKDLEAKSFPALFPDGKNTYDQTRSVKLSRSKYYNARMFSIDTRFASNTQYIFYAQYAYETEQLLNSISINLRKGSNAKHITPAMLMNNESLRSILKSDQGFRFFQPIRGSPEFWKKTMNDLFAMLRNLGLPTFFVTLSSAELSRWTCHLGAILKQSGDYRCDEEIMNMDYREKCKVLKSNPVTAVRMFYHRVEEFFKLVLLGRSNPIGKIKDYFYRIEFQARGAPHLHCLFWVENAPKFGVDSNDVVCEFIDKYISTTLPNQDLDPELYEIVSSVQMHSRNHSASCRKGKNKRCRFNFPKPVCDDTFIAEPLDHATESEKHETKLKKMFELLTKGLEVTENDRIYLLSGFPHFSDFQTAMKLITKKPSVVMKRNFNDVWVNNYNPDLLRAWNANIDIQYVLDPYSCIMYIVSYISKSETELGLVLKKARDVMVEEGKDCNSAKQMKQLGHKYFTHREISVQEAVVRLCGLKLKQFSRQVVFVPTNEEDTRMSIPLNQIKQVSETDNSNIWMISLYDRYCARPKMNVFENMCLASFAADYRVIAKSESKKCAGSENLYELQGDCGYILKRSHSKPAIIKYTKFSETSQPEKFYFALLKLYLPHRDIAQLKPTAYASYKDFYEYAAVKVDNALEKVSDIVMRNQKCINADKDAIDNAWELLQSTGDLQDAWAAIAPNVECDRQDQVLEQDESSEDAENSAEQQIPDLSTNENNRNPTRNTLCSYELLNNNIRPLLQSMNSKQREIFYYVRQWCLTHRQCLNVDPFHVFVTGGAGVGKSHLIRCIYNMSCNLLKNSDSPEDITVLLLAPTGTAAHNISGHTIHSVLKIPPKPKSLYQPLSSDVLNSLQSVLENVKIIIVDEFSMVSPLLLEYMDGRLRQIKGVSQSDESGCFGRVSILAVGDFHQLPPVRAHPLVLPMYRYGDILFRDNFKQVELTEIMRQKDDATFAQVLNRLRIKRKEDNLEPEATDMLVSRLDQEDEPSEALHVYATNSAADAYNNQMIDSVCDTVYILKACDYLKSKGTGKMLQLPVLRKGSSNDLPDNIKIGLNCRIMLTKNLDVENGLVNGVFGTVVGIDTAENAEDTVEKIYIKFDSGRIGVNLNPVLPDHLPKGTMVITKCDSQLDQHSDICRRQFPLKVGYACTVHKTQGMSVDKIVYDMKGTFVAGQAYVALSRVTSLNGLYLRNFNSNHIYMNEAIHKNLEHIPPLCLDKFHDEKYIDLVLHNVQGLFSKMDDIRLGYSKRCKIMCITESWLKPKHSLFNVQVDGFSIFRQDRCNDSGRGGVAIYVTENIVVERVPMPSNRNLEIVVNKVLIKGELIVIGCFYRSPNTNIVSTIEGISTAITIAESVKDASSIVLLGDFNENLLTNERHPVQECLTSRGYNQIVKESTYISGSLLDAVYVKGSINLQCKVNPVYFSDHETIEINFLA